MDQRVKQLRAQMFATALELEIAERGAQVPWDLTHDELVGILVKLVREFRGMSQVELSKVSGVDRVGIIDLEAGRRKPQDRTMRRLAKALRVPESQLDPHKVFRYLPLQPEAVAEQIREADKQAREEEREKSVS